MSGKSNTARAQQLELFGWANPPNNFVEKDAEILALPAIDGVEFKLDGTGFNTKIGYLYRDADNYKQFKAVVLEGRLSRASIIRMYNAIFGYNLFIPSDVGLQDLQPLFENGWEIEADHPWHELHEIAYVDDPATSDEHQDIMTVTELVARWPTTAQGWDNPGAEARLIEAMGLSAGSKS
ncbi:MAG TPA: hypothetical protein VIJ52_00855 [Pseudolabrys sp.]